MSLPWDRERSQVASFMRRLYERGLTTCLGGNISLRDGDLMFITPSGTDKGTIEAHQVGVLALTGENKTPELRPSMETAMHLAVYRARPDVFAAVHAHPPVSSAFTALEGEVDTRLTAEGWLLLGRPVKAPYALMGSSLLAGRVAQALRSGNVVLMENHGVLTVGSTLLQAFERIEALESAARMTWITSSMGGVRRLSEEHLRELEEL